MRATITDPRDGFSRQLLCQSNSIKYRTALEGWEQNPTFGNGPDGQVSGSAGAFLGAGTRPNRFGKQKATATSEANSTSTFTLVVTPETVEVPVGHGGQIELNIEVPAGSFSGDINLMHDLGTGFTGEFTPSTITGGSGTAKLRISKTSLGWADEDDMTVTVTGTSGAAVKTDSAEITVTDTAPDFSVGGMADTVSSGSSSPVAVTISVDGYNGWSGAATITFEP